MDRRFLNAYIDPYPVKMLGHTMYPWCLKYRVRLMAFESPLITGSRTPTPEDLMLAVRICAEQPIGKFSLTDIWHISMLSSSEAKFFVNLDRFSQYVLVSNWPKFWERETKKGTNGKGIPWPLAIVSNLISSGIPEQRAWEMPECQAIWLNSALAISKGADISVMTGEEEAFMEQEDKSEASKPVASPAKVDPQDNAISSD